MALVLCKTTGFVLHSAHTQDYSSVVDRFFPKEPLLLYLYCDPYLTLVLPSPTLYGLVHCNFHGQTHGFNDCRILVVKDGPAILKGLVPCKTGRSLQVIIMHKEFKVSVVWFGLSPLPFMNKALVKPKRAAANKMQK